MIFHRIRVIYQLANFHRPSIFLYNLSCPRCNIQWTFVVLSKEAQKQILEYKQEVFRSTSYRLDLVN
ncbi:unnamed protein product [Schistosoma mattheei]|uniref:Uncharacterized protein n=1 Tax=Schistosoma mattheei TaxID=31246 RepID=A0A183P112_9TREM|nr:unnamed protein product [Schistosoma mattheei]